MTISNQGYIRFFFWLFFLLSTVCVFGLILYLYRGSLPDLFPSFFGRRLHHLLIWALLFFALAVLFKTGNRYHVAILASIVWVVYLANGQTLAAGDSIPARYLPISILREADFDLNEVKRFSRNKLRYYLQDVNGRYVSIYPIGAPILAIPYYAISAMGPVTLQSWLITELEKFAASGIVVQSVVLLFLALKRITSRAISFWIAMLYALCTSSLSISSQALWQHGSVQLGLVAILFCLLRADHQPRWIWVSGFAAGMIVVARPPAALVLPPIVVYIFIYHPKQTAGFCLSALPWALLQFWYNHTYFQNIFHTQFPVFDASAWSTPLWTGLTGTLLSPGRGLFIYSPIFFFSLVGIIQAFRKPLPPLFRYLSFCVLIQILMYAKWRVWWGGWTYGPRLLADVSPILCLFLVPILEDFRKQFACKKWLFALFLIFCLWSGWAHANGAFLEDRRWNSRKRISQHPEANWLWTDNQLVNPLRRIAKRVEIAWRGDPTHVSSPELLNAKYDLQITEFHDTGIQGTLRVTNTGKAAWLTTSREKAIRMYVQWSHKNQKLRQLDAQAFLEEHKWSGESVDFPFSIRSPDAPGNYVLQLGLLYNARWIPRSEVPPVQRKIRIKWVNGRKTYFLRNHRAHGGHREYGE